MNTTQTIKKIKRNVKRRLNTIIKQLARPSGFNNKGKPVQLFCRKDLEPINISNTLPEVYAVTTHGIYEDVYGGGAVLLPWRCISAEDLLKLEKYINNHKNELK